MIAHAFPRFPARSLALAVLLGASPGCSSAGSAPGSSGDADPTTDDAATSDTAAPATDDATSETPDEASADATTTDAAPDPAHSCPGCQATKCGKELSACGGSSTCVDWLMCMNECFKKTDVASCQTRCRATMDALAKKMDACTDASCHAECTPG